MRKFDRSHTRRPMTDETEARLDRLRLARSRLETQLADEGTPAYSIAPLANQLRLTDNAIDRLARVDDDDDEIPTPERAGLIDFLAFGFRSRRHRADPWTFRLDGVMAVWAEAGFVLPEPAYRERRDAMSHEEYLEAMDRWVDECRVELARCLAQAEESPC